MIFIACGADALADDPLSELKYTVGGYELAMKSIRWLTQIRLSCLEALEAICQMTRLLTYGARQVSRWWLQGADGTLAP
jgi:acetoin utilization deacetylase AcuC-like enzyme